MRLRRGFHKDAEEYAHEFRSELCLEPHAPLDPRILADHLEIPVYALSEHPTISEDMKAYFHGPGQSDFSATTLPDSSYREIIHNDSHRPNRQNSNIMHELAHIILGHPPKPPMISDSCRNFDATKEREANDLGFTLLVPKVAALHIVENIVDLVEAQRIYGISRKLLDYRIRKTDARRWAMNRARKGYTGSAIVAC